MVGNFAIGGFCSRGENQAMQRISPETILEYDVNARFRHSNVFRGSWQVAKNIFLLCCMRGLAYFARAQIIWSEMLWLFVYVTRKVNIKTIRHFLSRHDILLFWGLVFYLLANHDEGISPSLTAAIFAISDLLYS